MNARTTRSVCLYFLLTIALSLPFWLLGGLIGLQLLPALPFSALGVVCIVTAAAILSYRENGISGLKELLNRSFDFDRVKSAIWYLPAVLLMPLIMFLSYASMRIMGASLPSPQISVVKTLGLFIAFFVGALCEELGWSGYAIDPLQNRFGAFWAGMMVGAVWAAWHFIPLAEARRSPVFIAWWTMGTISMRVIIVWLCNNTGRSVFVAALFHAMVNLTWQLFPVNGSSYDPRVTSPILALAAALVIVVWGPKTLTRAPR
jgi:membrane protease YdiL (CAAX protease family)